MAGNIIDSFLVALGFETDTTGARQFSGALDGVRKGILAVTAVAGVLTVGLGLLINAKLGAAADLADFGETNNADAGFLNDFGTAAEGAGSSAEAMQSSVAGLNRIMGEAVLGVGRGAKIFENLGLSARGADGEVRTLDNQLDVIADKLVGLSRQEQIAFLGKVGIDPTLVNLLGEGSANFRAQIKANSTGLLSDEDFKKAGALNDKIGFARKAVSDLVTKIQVELYPVIERVVDAFIKWVREEGRAFANDVVTKVRQFRDALYQVWEVVKVGTDAIGRFITFLGGFENVIRIAAIALGTLVAIQIGTWIVGLVAGLRTLTIALRTLGIAGLIAAAGPLLIGAAFLALILIIDDLTAYANGADSVFGKLVEKYPLLAKGIQNFKDGIAQLGGILSTIGTALSNFWDSIPSGFETAIQQVKDTWESLKTYISDKIDFLRNKWQGFLAILPIPDIIKNSLPGAAPASGFGAPLFTAPIANGINQFDLRRQSGPLGKGANSGNSSVIDTSSVIINAPVYVTSPDAQEAGAAAAREVKKSTQQAIRNAQSEVQL